MKIQKTISSEMAREFVKRGFAFEVPYSICLQSYFTEEQKANNISIASKVSDDEWKTICEQTRARVAEDNLTAVYAIEREFRLGQFRPEEKTPFVFWFWCNHLENTVRDGRTGRDYSYVTLSIEDRLLYGNMTREEKEKVFARCREILRELPSDSNQATFQYSIEYDQEVLHRAAFEVFEKIKDQWVKYFWKEGKFSILEGYGCRTFLFRTKYAKGDNGKYRVSEAQLVAWGIDNDLI